MKKNFFKKLSFVLALAMIVSVIAPAAGAFAATAPKLNRSSAWLYVGQDGKNAYDFNVVSKPAGATVTFASANKKVATVNSKTGVTTGVAYGKTTMTATIKKSGKTVKTLKATLYVRDNIKTVDITNTETKVSLDKELALKTAFVTFGGSTTKTTSVVKFTVADAKGVATKDATVSAAGVFKASKTGDYTVTATAYQSETTFAAGVALTKDEFKINVPVEVKEVKLASVNSIAVTYNAEATVPAKVVVTDVKNKVALYQSATPTLSADKKTLTISTYDNFVNGNDYTVTLDGVDYTLTAKVGTISKIVLKDQTILANTATTPVFTVLDENGLDVTAKYPMSSMTVICTQGYDPLTHKITLPVAGQIAVVKLQYYAGVSTTGVANMVTSDQATITSVAGSYSSLAAWNIGTSTMKAAQDYTVPKQSVNISDTNAYIYGKATQLGNANYTSFSFVSKNPGVLVVDYASGQLTGITAGTATVQVIDANTTATVGYITVTVKDRAVGGSIALNTYAISLSNAITDNGLVILTSKDLGGDLFTGATPTVAPYNFTASASTPNLGAIFSPSTGTWLINVSTTTSAVAGTYTYKITKDNNEITYFNVVVAHPVATVSNQIFVNSPTFDTYFKGTQLDLKFSVYGVDANGVKTNAISGAGVTYTLTDPHNTSVTGAVVSVDNVLKSVTNAGNELLPGNWTLTVSVNNIVYTSTIVVTSSRPALAYTITGASAIHVTDVQTALRSLITVPTNYLLTVTSADFSSYNTNIIRADGTLGTQVGTVSVYVKSITVTSPAPESHPYVIDINQTFTFTTN